MYVCVTYYSCVGRNRGIDFLMFGFGSYIPLFLCIGVGQ